MLQTNLLLKLGRHQADLRQTLNRGEAVLIKPGDLELVEDHNDIRSRLAGQLKAYTEFKHMFIFPEFLTSTDPVVVQLAMQMTIRCDRMAAVYRRHAEDWPRARIVEQRALYRGVALDIVGRLRQHLAREEADVARLTQRSTSDGPRLHPQRALTGF